jgi:hypothetical protein
VYEIFKLDDLIASAYTEYRWIGEKLKEITLLPSIREDLLDPGAGF